YARQRRARTSPSCRITSTSLAAASAAPAGAGPSEHRRGINMSFREKSAWISFALLLVLTGIWAWTVVQMATGQLEPSRMLWIAHDVMVAFIVLQILLHGI